MEFKNYNLSVSSDISIFESEGNKYIIANKKMRNNTLVGKQILDIIDLIKLGGNCYNISLLKAKYSTFLSEEKLISIIEDLINNGILIYENIENIPQKGYQESYIKLKINILKEEKINKENFKIFFFMVN